MYSSGVYHLNRSGIVESIDKNIIVVRLDKLNEQDEDFKNVNTLQLDCRNCSYELENLKEGTKIIFYYFPYNADVRPLKVENIYVINEKESNIDLMKKAGQLLDPYRDKTDESIYARGKSGGVITTKDIEQATEFYILAGYEQSDAEDKAVDPETGCRLPYLPGNAGCQGDRIVHAYELGAPMVGILRRITYPDRYKDA